jgi:gliding motility-associated-like protein
MKSLKRFSIYNRSGNLVFATTKDGEGWDGTYKGRAVDTGVFVWMIEYITTDNKPAMEKGTITVVR